MTTFALSGFLTNTIAALGASASLSSFTIYDGIDLDMSYPNDFIAVAHDGSDGEFDMTVATGHNSYLTFAEGHEESVSVPCLLVCQDGSSSWSDLRSRAYVGLSALDTVIRANSSMTASVLNCFVDSHSLSYRATNSGNGVIIRFSISYIAAT